MVIVGLCCGWSVLRLGELLVNLWFRVVCWLLLTALVYVIARMVAG